MQRSHCKSLSGWAQSSVMLDWDDFKFFSAVARTGSVRGAGKALGVHASTVTRRLEQLEQRLGIRLFARTRTGLVISVEGAEVVQALDEVQTRLEAIEQRLQGRDANMAGVVRLNVPEAFAPALFMLELGTFSGQFPEVDVEISRKWQLPDLDQREADLSVVLTNDPPGHLIGRAVGRMTLAGYGSVAPAPGLEGRWLSSALELAVAPQYTAQARPASRKDGYLETIDLQLAAVFAGIGSTLLPRYLVHGNSQLVAGDELRRDIWLLSHPESRGIARVQAVADLIVGALREHDLETTP
jgi:DNA-binding transcriptional LysR family regulator